MTNLNLNDGTKWQWQRFKGDDDYVQLGVGQLAWRAASLILGRDRKARILSEQMRYLEASSAPADAFGAQLALMEQAGLQQITFDGVTYIQAEFAGFKSRDMVTLKAAPYYWVGNLEFLCPTPYFSDIASTVVAAVPIVNPPPTAPSGAVAAGGALATGTYTLQYTYVTSSGETAPSPLSSGIVLTTGNQQITVTGVTLPSFATAVKWYFGTGSPTTGFTVQNNGAGFTLNTAGNGVAPPATTPATTFNITYAGSVRTNPVWTLTIPNTNAAPIQSFALSNTMSGEALTVTFPGNLAASTAWTITIDAGVSTVTDQSGKGYDLGGSFPKLYGPAGQVQQISATLTPASGTATGCTIGASYQNRWLI